MIKLEFYKICCAGNDFIVVDNRKKLFNAEYQENLVEMLVRNYAIGRWSLFYRNINDS